jgi:hypothetical protein
MPRVSHLALAALLFSLPLAVGCSKTPTRWDEQAKKIEEKKAEAKDAPPKVDGAKLNAFFPAETFGDNKRKFTAEKDGYVEAQILNKDGKVVAQAAITEVTDAKKLEEFEKAEGKLDGFPMLSPTKKKTNVLVNKKWQVSIISEGDALPADDQKKMLEKFNLKGLAAFTPPAK